MNENTAKNIAVGDTRAHISKQNFAVSPKIRQIMIFTKNDTSNFSEGD